MTTCSPHARNHIQPRGLTALMGGKIALADGMIHHQDIRRPLHLPREIPAARLAAALDTARAAPTLAAAQRIRGLALTATDLDWTTGDGPAVEGPGEALLMAIAGRGGIIPELSGTGFRSWPNVSATDLTSRHQPRDQRDGSAKPMALQSSERPWSEVASLRMLRLDADVAQTLSCSRFLLAMAEVYMIDGAARRDAGSR